MTDDARKPVPVQPMPHRGGSYTREEDGSLTPVKPEKPKPRRKSTAKPAIKKEA